MSDTVHDNNDTSDYLLDEKTSEVDLGGLFSRDFSNIRPMYVSPGGPCALYSATRYGKRFVLKGLKEDFRNDPINNLALAKEFEIGMSLEHPNIRRTLGLEEVDGLGRVIVLEYVDGRSLADVIRDGSLSRADGRALVAQIGDALDYIHSKEVYHRDLKPSNILVSHQGNTAKIIDFNLSDSNSFVVLKNPAGTRKYMAPELVSHDAAPTAVADIYSFGMIMEELAAVTDDEDLGAVARRCTAADPCKRPTAVSLIRLPSPDSASPSLLSRILASKALTWILSFLCLALTFVIANHLLWKN